MLEAGPDLETDLQDLSQPKTGEEDSKGPDVMENILSKLESIFIPEVGLDLKDDLQEVAQPKNDHESREGHDVKQVL